MPLSLRVVFRNLQIKYYIRLVCLLVIFCFLSKKSSHASLSLCFLLHLASPEVLLVPGVVSIAVIPKLVLYLGHDDGPRHPRLGVPLEVAHPGQQLSQVDLGSLLSSDQGLVFSFLTQSIHYNSLFSPPVFFWVVIVE